MTTATPSAVAAPIATIFAINDGFVLPAIAGLTHDELWKAPTDRNNGMLWIAGHVVQTRAMILQVLGEPVDTGWGKLFDRGAPRRSSMTRSVTPQRATSNALCARSRRDCTRSWRRSTTRISPHRPECRCQAPRPSPTSSRSSRSTSPITSDSWRTFARGLGIRGLRAERAPTQGGDP